MNNHWRNMIMITICVFIIAVILMFAFMEGEGGETTRVVMCGISTAFFGFALGVAGSYKEED